MVLFIKYVKWFFSMSAFIVGVAYLETLSYTGNLKYLGIIIPSFGLVYLLSTSTFEAPKLIFASSVGVLVVAGILAHLVIAPFVAYYLGASFFMSWFLCAAVIGLPVMLWAFSRED